MRIFDLQSERYAPTGSISADGIKNQLGRPKLDRLSLLAREAVQNSWDARSLPKGGVRFGVAAWTLSEQQRRWLLQTALAKHPKGLDVRTGLSSQGPIALALYDRGTKGLCGPTRADEVRANETANFVNLLRNVGRPPAAFRGGGTYGFGKTALFLASQIRTIAVHTQFATGRKFQERFIIAALGSQYEDRVNGSRCRLTGRHWWGRRGRGDLVDPLIGSEARNAAKMLGLREFGPTETGTTIVILLPELDGRSPEDAVRFIGDAIIRSYWPKMVDGSGLSGTMSFELSWEGRTIPLPRPAYVPPLDSYVKAFSNLRAHIAGRDPPHEPAWLRDIYSQRPAKHLGTLSILRFPSSPRVGSPSELEADDNPLDGPSHHTVLMRGPHFVVDYLAGPPLPYEIAEYAGVFLANAEVEEAFAQAEPPTHDSWSPDMLDSREDRTIVRVGLRKIREAMNEFAGAPTIPRTAADSVPLGGFSDLLGGLIASQKGTGARNDGGVVSGPKSNGREQSGSPGSPPTQEWRPRIRILSTLPSEEPSQLPTFALQFDLDADERRVPVRVIAQPGVVLEGGSVEHEPPVGSTSPRILRWTDRRGAVLGTSTSLVLQPRAVGPWIVFFETPDDSAVLFDLVAEPVEP